MVQEALKSTYGRFQLGFIMQEKAQRKVSDYSCVRAILKKYDFSEEYDQSLAIPGNGECVEVFSGNKAPNFEIVALNGISLQEAHNPDAFGNFENMMEESADAIIDQEDANFVALADYAAEKFGKIETVDSIMSRLGSVYPIFSNILMSSFDIAVCGAKILVTNRVPAGIFYCFAENIGEFKQIVQIEANSVCEDGSSEIKYLFSERISMVITKPQNVMKLVVKN